MAKRAEIRSSVSLNQGGGKNSSTIHTDGPDAGLYVTSLATAAAIGESTLASSATNMSVASHGRVTITRGETTSRATSLSSDGIAFTTADTGVTASGADLLRSKTSTSAGGGTTEGSAWSSEYSTTTFFILDVAGHAGPRGQATKVQVSAQDATSTPPILTGNTATFEAYVLVTGEATLADVRIEALTIEDMMSVSTIQATGAVGDWMLVG